MSNYNWIAAPLLLVAACILALAPQPLEPSSRLLLASLLLLAAMLQLRQAFRVRRSLKSPVDPPDARQNSFDKSLQTPKVAEATAADDDDRRTARSGAALTGFHISNLTAAARLLDKMTEQERTGLLQLRARQDAVTAREARSGFAGSLSNAVLGMLDMLRLTSLTRKQETYIRVMESSSSMLLSLLDNMIDFASLESGGLRLKEDTFAAPELLESILEIMGYQAQMKGLELVGIGEYDPDVDLVGDFVRLRQIMINLVNNGIKFTEKGSVTIRLGLESGHEEYSVLTVSVTDTGIGMSAEAAREIFDSPPLETAFKSSQPGSGLGIAITKMLIDMMDGRIRYESRPGNGTKVEFTVPLSNAPTSERQANRFRAIFDRRRMLVLSGSETVSESICSFLHMFNVNCERESDLEFAMTRLSDADQAGDGFDCIIIDDESNRALPAAKRVRQTSDLAILLLTPISRPLRIGEISKISRIRCVNKPVLPGELYTNLSRLLQADRDDAYAVPDESFYPLQILVGEDNPLNQRVLCSMLESIGFDSDTAEDGPGVLAAVENKHHETDFA